MSTKPSTSVTVAPQRGELDRFLKGSDGRSIGAGACEDPSQISAAIADGLNCGIEELEVVAENRAFYGGPLTAASMANLFKPQLNPFEIGTAQGATDQAQINIDNAEMDCNVLITHMYFHLVPPKELMLVEGGVLTPLPAAGGASIPVVPDAWLKTDAATDGSGTLGLGAGQQLTKAYLDVGEWVCDFFYDWCRANEWLWKIGNNILMQAPLTKIASIRGSAQPWTSGRSRKPFDLYVNQANAYLRANGSTGVFYPRNATQSGTITDAHTTAGVKSLFQPYGYQEEEVTFGGPGVQELCQNPTVYELCTAMLYPRGVKLNSVLNLIDSNAQALAQQQASINNTAAGTGAIPNVIGPDTSVTPGTTFVGSGVLPVFDTLTSDIAGPAQAFQQVPLGTMRVKIGQFYLVAGLMGHRVSQSFFNRCVNFQDTLCQQVKANTNGRVSLAVMAQ